MGKFKRIALFVVIVIFPATIFAQFNNNTTSPYSRYGLGDLQSGTTGRAASMGGAVLGSRNKQQINMKNPASYTSIDSMAFLFEFGLKAKLSNYKTDISSMSTNDVNFDYFAFSFPVSKRIGISMGMTPFSDSGYDVQLIDDVENFGKVWHRYHGEGTLSRVYFGLGIEPIKNISVGTNLYYFFGTLTRNANIEFLQASDLYSDQKYEQIRLRDFGFNYGLQATLPLKGKKSFTLGVTLENKPEITAFHSELTQKYLTSSTNQDIDTISFSNEVKDIIKMPLSYGVGLSYSSNEKLEISADYVHQSWSQATFFGSSYSFLTDLDRFSLGFEVVPDKYSIRNYFDKVAYRSGIKYEKSYLMLNGQQLNDIGISFGVGLPVYRSLSTINFSAEFGKRGTTSDNLVREFYTKLTLSVNLHDIWFIKRKFD
jgi:hypothetical protein